MNKNKKTTTVSINNGDAASSLKNTSFKYMELRSNIFHLYHGETFTGFTLERSHEGFNHFACWLIKFNGKIKKNFPLKEKEPAMAKGISLYLEKITNNILRGGKYG
jgi:hypothetical protein